MSSLKLSLKWKLIIFLFSSTWFCQRQLENVQKKKGVGWSHECQGSWGVSFLGATKVDALWGACGHSVE